MAITPEDITSLSELARIELTSEEKKTLHTDLVGILEYVDQLQAVSDEAPAAPSVVTNVLREDTEPHASREHTEAILEAAPKRQEEYIAVKKILGGSDAA